MAEDQRDWPDLIHAHFKRVGVRQVGYVPDAGHSRLIHLCKQDNDIADVVLTTEEEGVGLVAGATLGGQRAALLMQSSGVGNCINMLSLPRICRFPLLMFITMRGEWEEFNPWQVPMGSIVDPVLKLCEAEVYRAREPADVAELAERAARQAFADERIVAVLLSQELIGKKVWTQ
jgi:sulfopyruvate decarboxylase alpha subunit